MQRLWELQECLIIVRNKPQLRTKMKIYSRANTFYNEQEGVRIMFGILKDIAKETVKTVKCIDEEVTNIYHKAKEVTEDMGIGPESIRNMMRGK